MSEHTNERTETHACDSISRQKAIDTVKKMRAVCDTDSIEDYEALLETAFEVLPSAQPEPCEDAVSREAVSSWLKQYGQDVLHGKYEFSLMYIWKNLMDLPSVQPEIIRCKDCRHNHNCDIQYHAQAGDMFFCAGAERRTDE